MKLNKKVILSIMTIALLLIVPVVSANEIRLKDADGFEEKVNAHKC